MIKRISIAALFLVILLLGAILILPGLVPTDTYREKLETELSQTLARDVKILGDIELSTFPVIEIQTGPVTLSNPTGFSDSNFVDVEGMAAKVKLWPLFRKQVEISRIILDGPIIRLEKLAEDNLNWTVESEQAATSKTDESGSFKRDGRFTEYDPSLALLQINDGIVTYSDAVSGQSLSVKNINLSLRAPSLKDTLKLDGDLTIDGLDTKLGLSLDSPHSFLTGLETPFDAEIETDEGKLRAAGRFTAGEDIAFDATFTSDSDEPVALAERLPLPEDLTLPDLSQLTANGDITYTPSSTKLPRLEFAAVGTGLDVSYVGDLNIADKMTAGGRFSAKIEDMSLLESYLDEPVQALEVVSAVEADGTIELMGDKLSISSLKASLTGSELEAQFDGQASFDKTLKLNGNFSGETSDFPKLLSEAGLDQSDAAALRRVTANGVIALKNEKATLSDLTASAKDGFLNGDFSGQISYADALEFNGEFSGSITDLGALDEALPREIPYSDVAKKISLSSQISTTPAGYNFSNLTAALQDGLLNGDFSGNLVLGDKSDISGQLSLNANSMRSIALTQNVEMPPSTDDGEIFEAFQISGAVSGTPDRINFDSGLLRLDSVSANGDFVLHLSGEKPLLEGALVLDPLDLRPYMAAWSEQKPDGIILPWSTTPINLEGIDAVDAEITITAPSVKMDRLKFDNTEARATLKNGILSTNISRAKLYDGEVDGAISISSRNGTPALSVRADIKSVAAQSFLSAASGFDRVVGIANLSLSFEGQGLTQDAIMKSLSGSGSFNILDGQLRGIDAEELLSGVDQALANKQLPPGLGLGKVTNFNDLTGSFSVSDGRVTVRRFNLKSGGLFMDADGLIDIGDQRLDFGLQPKLAEGSDLAQFGIPLKFSGLFGQAKPGLDTQMLGEIAKAKARDAAGDAVRDRVSGPLGDILGGIVGGGSSPDTTPPEIETSPESESPDPSEEPEASEEAAPSDIKPAEEQIENALKGLFGRKKKKSDGE